jgi:GxxExxY protein
MAIELEECGLSWEGEVPISIRYRERPLRTFRMDMVVEGRVVVELKSVERLERIHLAQALSYLRATHYRLALLVNFNVEMLRAGLKRVVL